MPFRKFVRLMSSRRPLPASQLAYVVSRVPGTDKADIADSTLKQYKRLAYQLQKWAGCDVDVLSLSRQDVAEFHEWLDQPHLSTVTINGRRRRLNAAWNRLRERGYQVCDIAGLVQMKREPVPPGKAIADDWIQRLLLIANARDVAMILLMVDNGFRRQTLPRILVSQLDITLGDDGLFRLVGEIPEEKISRPRPIFGKHATCLAVLNWLEVRPTEFDAPELFVNLQTGEPLTVEGLGIIMRNMRKKANVPHGEKVFWHAFRHRFAQTKLDEGYDPALVAQWMGITVETLLQVYATRTAARLAQLYFERGAGNAAFRFGTRLAR